MRGKVQPERVHVVRSAPDLSVLARVYLNPNSDAVSVSSLVTSG